MRFLPLITPLLPLTAALPSFLPRAADLGAQVRAQIDVLNSSNTELLTAVNNFDGSLLGLIPQSLAVITASTKVDQAVQKTTSLTTQSSNFTAAESSSIVTTLASLITPIQGTLTALTAKYPVFKRTLESPIVLLNLKVLKTHTDDLVEALGQKVTPTWASYLTLGQGILDKAFDDAIAVYSA